MERICPDKILTVRDRLMQRAAQAAPTWSEPVYPAARNSAGALLAGALLGKLPEEDASALCKTIIAEQNEDGSWPRVMGGAGDFSKTLEIVQALSFAGTPAALGSLEKSVHWLEARRRKSAIDLDALILLGALTDFPYCRISRFGEVLAGLVWKVHGRRRISHSGGKSARLALEVLRLDRVKAVGRTRALIEMQCPDGSWHGSTRDTVLAMIALRHASLPRADTVFERGWRFLRGLQVWDGERLVQNPCDPSTLMHAMAVRSLVWAGADPEMVLGSVLSLQHQARQSGGWGAGASLPTDILTTSLALDALSLVGNKPVETDWVRRRGVLLLLRSQLADGGWPLYPGESGGWGAKLAYRSGLPDPSGRVTVTAMAVLALTYNSGFYPNEDRRLRRGVEYLLRRQRADGTWTAHGAGLVLLTTAWAIEALAAAAHDRARAEILKGLGALIQLQRDDGGWGEPGGPSTPHHTAWVMRALQQGRVVPLSVLQGGRDYLERGLDESILGWRAPRAAFPLPLSGEPAVMDELTSLWALEAWSPLVNNRLTARQRTARSLFDRSV